MLVETLDRCFENVCELDLIFHLDKVHYILNEMVMGGMVLETSLQEIVSRFHEQEKIVKAEVSIRSICCMFLFVVMYPLSVYFYCHLSSSRQVYSRAC